jgi:hypothetical protein
MGGIADRWGVSESFYILGAFMLMLCAPLAFVIRRISAPPQRNMPPLDS